MVDLVFTLKLLLFQIDFGRNPTDDSRFHNELRAGQESFITGPWRVYCIMLLAIQNSYGTHSRRAIKLGSGDSSANLLALNSNKLCRRITHVKDPQARLLNDPQ